MLNDSLKDQLQQYLARLARPVELIADLDDSDGARQMATLLAEIAALSPLVSYRAEPGSGGLRPSFAVREPHGESRIRFAGVPLGHEFTSLVLALLQVGGHPPKADAALLERARTLRGPLQFETFVSMSCQLCPDVVQALNLLAVVNGGVRHTMVDGALFQDEVARRDVMAVPTVFLNGQPFSSGRMTLKEIVAQLDTGAAADEAEALSHRAPYDVLVVGGGPAGASAAIYAARKGIRTGLVAERFGGQLMDTVGIENFVSVVATEGPKLAANLEAHVRHYDVDVITGQRSQALVPGELIELRLAGGATLRTRSVVLATGARWREIAVPGEREYRNRGVAYCPHCDGPLFKGRSAAVIGGGNSGVEAAIDLAGIASHVTLIEYDAQLRADAVLVRKLGSLPNVRVITSAQTLEVRGDGQRVTGLVYRDRTGGDVHEVALAGIFVQIGLVPNTDWLKGTLKLSARGEIDIDERGATSVPGVFAAGDCTTVPFKQIVIAAGEGAKAALAAFDHLIRSPVAAAA